MSQNTTMVSIEGSLSTASSLTDRQMIRMNAALDNVGLNDMVRIERHVVDFYYYGPSDINRTPLNFALAEKVGYFIQQATELGATLLGRVEVVAEDYTGTRQDFNIAKGKVFVIQHSEMFPELDKEPVEVQVHGTNSFV